MSQTLARPLGRGLSALLGPDLTQSPSSGNSILYLSTSELAPGKYQPREHFDQESLQALIASIQEKGVIQPILVRPIKDGPSGYEIVAGERRWRAAQEAGMREVPVIIREFSDIEALETALIENIQRNDLTALEEAQGYKRLIDEFSYTQEEIGKALGKSRSHIANSIRLMSLPDSIKSLLRDSKLTAGHARALLSLDDPEETAKKIINQGLNVRQAEKLVQSALAGPKRPAASRKATSSEGHQEIEQKLEECLGLKASLALKGSGGTLTIEFKNYVELDQLLARLSGT